MDDSNGIFGGFIFLSILSAPSCRTPRQSCPTTLDPLDMKIQFLKIGVLAMGCISALAQAHEHGAHVHGSAKMNIAFDGLQGKVELHGPGDSLIGFEYKAKSAADKKKQADALNILETKMGEMVVFDSASACFWQKDKIEVAFEEGGHSDVNASWLVHCQKSLMNTKVIFNVQKFFPRVKDLDVQLLVDTAQISVEANKVGMEVLVK